MTGSSAPTYRLDSTALPLVSIEYPGPVASKPQSTAAAIATLGGHGRLTRALCKTDGIVELNFRPDVTFSHAVGGDTVEAGNTVVLKVVKRRRKKRPEGTAIEQDGTAGPGGKKAAEVQSSGVFTLEVVGAVSRVVRFKAMADLQYQGDGAEDDPTVKVANAMRKMDVSTIQAFRFPEPNEDFDELRILPPPVFSRLTLPQIYDYRPNPLSIPTTTTNEDGTEITRLVNKAKYKGDWMISVPFSTPPDKLPKGPPPDIGQVDVSHGLETATLDKLYALFKERPVWSRAGLLNNLSKTERSKVMNYKITIPFVSWSFSDGPYREACVRYGYDPRQHQEARLYQRVVIRNMTNSRVYLKRVAGASAPGTGDLQMRESEGTSHIFDGESVSRTIGNYQLCDITDPLLARIISNTDYVRDECNARDGWWEGEYLEYIRQVLRRKFFSLLEHNEQLPESAMDDLTTHMEEYARTNSLGPYRQTGEATSGTGEADGTPGEGAGRAKIKPSSLRHLQKPTAKPKAIPGRDRSRARSSLSLPFDSASTSEPAYVQDVDTIMEEREEPQEMQGRAETQQEEEEL